jgi:predicted PilT family ATPase
MPFCRECGKDVEHDWVTCPFCSQTIGPPALNSQTVQDSVIGQDFISPGSTKIETQTNVIGANAEEIAKIIHQTQEIERREVNNKVLADSKLTPEQKVKIETIVHEWAGVPSHFQFTNEKNAILYVPREMISTLIGKRGERVLELKRELDGIIVSIEALEEQDIENPRIACLLDDFATMVKSMSDEELNERGIRNWRKRKKGRRKRE